MPTHVAVVFDYSGKSFRNDIYPTTRATAPSRRTNSFRSSR